MHQRAKRVAGGLAGLSLRFVVEGFARAINDESLLTGCFSSNATQRKKILKGVQYQTKTQ